MQVGHIPAPDPAVLEEAAQWFAVLRSERATAQEHDAWRSWLEQGAAQREAWRFIETISARFEPLRAADQRAGAGAALRSARSQRISRRQALRGIGLTAAGGLLGWATWRHALLRDGLMAMAADYRTGTGEVKDFTLADGSRIWLNTDSALDADLQPALRRLRLWSGEVLIETAAHAQRPFVVDTAEGRLRALGTRFTVRRTEDRTCVAVYQGAVEVHPVAGETTRVVPAGAQLAFGRGSIGPLSPAEPARQAWAQGVLLADDIPLGELIAELGRYRHGHLGVAPDVAGLRVMGTYPLADTDRVLAMLETALPVRVRRTLPWWTTVEAR